MFVLRATDCCLSLLLLADPLEDHTGQVTQGGGLQDQAARGGQAGRASHGGASQHYQAAPVPGGVWRSDLCNL